MGGRLASVVLGVALAGTAYAQPHRPPAPAPAPAPVSDAKRGMELYNAGDFANAVPLLERAHEASPDDFDVHLALAEALRQSGRCEDALPHYRALTGDPAKRDDVLAKMALCPTEPPPPPPPAPAPPAPPPAPVIVHDSDTSTVLLAAGAGASIATAVCFAIAANDASSDANAAALYKDYSAISARSTALYIASGVTAAVGVGLAVTAILRVRSSREHATKIAITPRSGGGAIVLERSW